METYLRGLIKGFAAVQGDDRFLLLGDSRYLGDLLPDDPRFSPVAYNGFTPGSLGWALRGVARNLFGLDLAAGVLRTVQADLIHHPFSLLTPGGKGRSVVTMHDLQHEFFPEFFPVWVLRKKRREYRRAAVQADRIITISEYVRKTLLDCYSPDPAKVSTVYLGVTGRFSPDGEPEQDRLVLKRHGVERPFIFYPAATWPHKNHLTLLAAFRQLKEAHRFEGDLVLSGIAKGHNAAVQQEIQRLGLTESVRMTGYFPVEELPPFYRRAELLAFPSLFEGFGLPLLEAMACGCPVVCSNATSLPEIAGGAALLFSPDNPDELAAQMQRVLDDTLLRDELKRAGIERAGQFTWERTARETMAVYQAAVQG